MVYQKHPARTNKFLPMGSIIGDSVRTPRGEKIGQIEEVIFDADTGHVSYAILSFTGLLGLGDRLFVIPWQWLRLDTRNRCLIINMDKEKLAFAPGFGRDSWPDIADPMWANEIMGFYQDNSREPLKRGASEISA